MPWTLPNSITLGRLLVASVLFVMLGFALHSWNSDLRGTIEFQRKLVGLTFIVKLILLVKGLV